MAVDDEAIAIDVRAFADKRRAGCGRRLIEGAAQIIFRLARRPHHRIIDGGAANGEPAGVVGVLAVQAVVAGSKRCSSGGCVCIGLSALLFLLGTQRVEGIGRFFILVKLPAEHSCRNAENAGEKNEEQRQQPTLTL